MTSAPPTRYARHEGVHIAYQVFGDAPRDLIFVWGPISNVEVVWEHPAFASWMRRLATFARVIHFDKRGTGLSDRSERTATFEEQIDDVLAVLDATESRQAAILGGGSAGMLAVLFAAAHPERASALILADAQARLLQDHNYPWGLTAEQWARRVERAVSGWGRGVSARVAPSQSDDAGRRWWAKLERHSLSPGSVRPTFETIAQTDVRAVLPSVHVPALVIHRRDDVLVEVGHGRYLAEHLPDARWVEVPGVDHPGWAGDPEPELQEIEAFLTGVRPGPRVDRMLATVLFTDIVGSSQRASEMGDQGWRQVLDAYDQTVLQAVSQRRGRLIKTIGDGALAIFDGPVRAIEAATSLREDLRALGLTTRTGLHAGEVEQRGDDISGITVHVAQRIQSLAQPGEVLVSRTLKDLVAGSGIAFAARGTHTLKGIPDDWQLHAVQT